MTASITRLPAPPTRESAPPIAHEESHRLVRERAFPASQSVEDLLAQLRESGFTGTLQIDLNQGGIGTIRLREEKRIEFSKK
jgi:hypothetical protein